MCQPQTLKHNSLSSPVRGKSLVAQGKANRPQPWDRIMTMNDTMNDDE